MDSSWLLSHLRKSRLLRNRDEFLAFEAALLGLVRLTKSEVLYFDALCILTDDTEHPEVMWGLMQYLEGYAVSHFIDALCRIPAEIKAQAEGWLGTMFNRACNHGGIRNEVIVAIENLSDTARADILDWIKTNSYIRPEHQAFFA